MLKARYFKYILHFKEPSGTSRGIMREKETYFIKVWEEETPEVFGLGECALFRGLSADDRPGYAEMLENVCEHMAGVDLNALESWSSIRFGVEMALADLRNGGKRVFFPSSFSEGRREIEINGLIWMGDRQTMQRRIEEKLKAGFCCIKLKIGAIDFEAEVALLRTIRERFGREEVELRVDANGAFSPEEAMSKLEILSRFDLHSIEQPIWQGQWEQMARLCARTPVPVALDEELIGIYGPEEKKNLLRTIRPQYIILKPALVGGFQGAGEWISLAGEEHIRWWVTSALESNVGLNALAQWVATLDIVMPQGLGTGQLYTNNIDSPLRQKGSRLYTEREGTWDLEKIWR